MAEGRVESIFVAPDPGAPMQAKPRVTAVAGAGLEGDRYRAQAGTLSKKKTVEPQGHLTLIEAEALEGAERDHGVALPVHLTRRNIITRGIALNHFVGRELQVGPVIARGIELCEPCGHMERLAGVKGARQSLVHRGGLRCEILLGGEIAVGDAISAAPAYA